MCWTVLHLLILMTLSSLMLAEDEHVSCPDNQKSFGGSCYEFVGLQRSFFSAQAWCEKSGGHLAFIPNKETQYFLQRQLDHDKDAWLGVAQSASNNLQYPPTAEGPFSWLDGSYITYSNWVNSPPPEAACGHMLRHSDFKWKATKDCNKRLPFICQFESGSSIVCAGHHTTLQCGSGQVVIIDGGFYGRKNIHYCRATASLPTTSKHHQCGWVDVVETLSALCDGRQACQVAEVMKSFGEPCPVLGSYLSVDYQCKDGLSLAMSTVAAVFNDITITVKWLLDLSWVNVDCKLSTGDGHVIYLDSPVGLESSVVHKYSHPSTFVVTVKCTSNDIRTTAEKIIMIQEPIAEIGAIRCYAGNLSFNATNCKALYGRAFQIQMEVNAGTNVTYTIQSNKILLSSLSVARGSIPHNITVIPEMVAQLGPGCHQLKLYASNMVTFPQVSADLQVCVLEKVAGLQASILTERNDCLNSDIIVGVSLEEGAPVLLLFSLRGDNNSSFYETREMNTRKEIFHIGHQIEVTVVKLRAWNVFSSLEVDLFSSCGKDSVSKLNSQNGQIQLSFTRRPRKKHNRVIKSLPDITATPSYSVPTRNSSIKLSTSDPSGLNDNSKRYQWSCKNPCKCQGNYDGLTHTITKDCLPNPSEFNKYYFEEIKKGNNKVDKSESICIILTPDPNKPDWLSLTCTQGCDPVNENTDAKFNLDCKGHDQCNQVVWNIEDLNNKDWPDETKSCYSNAGKNPLKVMQNGGTELTVSQSYLKMAKYNKQDLVVVIYSGDVVPLYTTYTINTFSSENPKPTPTKQSDATDKTTKGGNGEGEQNGPYPPNVPATPSTENQGPNPASNTKQPGASDKTTKGGNGEGEQNGPFPPNVPATPSTENQGPNPASNTKQPGASDKTTKGGNGEGEQNGPYPPNVPATPSTENQGPNPASNTKQPGASDKTTKGGNGEGEQNRPYPPNVPATPSTENQGPNPASTTKKPDATDKTTKGGSNEGETNSAYPSNTNGPIGVTTITITTARTSQTSLPISNNLNRFSCSISPSSGTILDAFSITCKTNFHCSKCHYCFKIKEKQLRCSMNNEVKSLFLPLGDKSSNYNLVITATVKQGNLVDTTTMTTQVKDSTAASGASVNGLKASLESAVDKLKNQGLMSGEAIGQLLSSLSSHLNSQSQELEKGDGQKLRVQMLGIMIDAVKEAPPTTPDNVQVIADGISAIIQPGTEPSNLAQEQASLLLVDLSSSLLHMIANSSEESMNEIISAASTIVEGASNILEYSSSKNISDAVLNTLYNIQSALLMFKSANDGPTIIQQANIAVFVKRVKPGSVHTESISIPNSSCPAFSLPALPSKLFQAENPVDIRMLSLNKSPFSWNERGNISGPIGGLSLTTTDGTGIPVKNLTENIEILLPRPAGDNVNISVLDLGNYSTTFIDVPSTDNMLLLKMVPSKDPLPFKVFLGYKVYPTETSYVAMTEMPYKGKTLEERYSWLLDPKTLKGNTGLHYLVVRPIVGPGIKSINASLSITSISASCKFWDEALLDWRTYGCQVGVKTTNLVTQCLCNHLTFFGSSFFVTPNLVDPSRTAELFATFAQNPVVVCFVGALFLAYLLVVVWARRKDVKDMAKLKVFFLEDNDPMDDYRYLLTVSTGHRRGGSTSSQVTITLLGAEENSEPHHLSDPKKRVFERGAVDMFLLTTPFSLGELHAIRLWHNNSGSHPAWFVGNVVVQDLQTDQKWYFLCNTWLAIDVGDCSLDKVFPVSTEVDLKKFSNLFFMKVSKDFSDGHIWYSVVNRPPNSTFTCVQRVSCCFSLLLCTMLTSIMFYGIPTDPSEQVMEMGNFEFTWQQFMIGVQSSLIMFPVNFLIVGVFRQTRPWETSCCKRKAKNVGALEQESTSQTSSSQTAPTDKNVTLDIIINDITRLAHSLSKNVKSNIPCQVMPGQQVEVSDVLSVVEQFIAQNYKIYENTQSKTKSFCNVSEPHTPESKASVQSGTRVDAIQSKSNKTQYLYRQLCHIHKQLRLLGPSGFHTPHSYNQALQQVHRMKGLLEDQILTSSSVNLDGFTQKKLSPAESSDGDGNKIKRVCCHGGLPWWFIFVGWLLVIATSFVAGFFTMLYGLKFGKGRSINWLVSMMVSFFQSILVIQPLKVICLAVFFALIIKKVDEDDFQNVEFVTNSPNREHCKKQQTVRQNRTLYEPPASADIEKMKKNKMLEQKAFALLREIVAYMVFLSMLLVVAYTLRDPNSFYLNQHILNSFTGQISDSMSIGDVFTWANTCLLNNLFGVYPGFITDGNSKLLGTARLRQLRVRKNSCQIPRAMLQFAPDCQAPYSWEVEDMGSYDAGWNHSMTNNISANTFSPWGYQTSAQLRVFDIWGKLALYRGGGFVAELGPDLQNASRTLEYLFNNKWLDTYTRAIIVEFTVYNANVNLFCVVTLLLETPAIGAFQFNSEMHSVRLYQPEDGLSFLPMAAEIIYLLFILYYMFLQGKLMKRQRWAYFRIKWNLLELTIILLSWAAVAVYIKMTLLGNRNITYYQSHKDEFASFYDTAATDSDVQYLIAFLVLFSTFKLWHLLRLNPKMYMITATLQKASSDISSFLVVIGIMFLAYSIASNVIYGWKLSSYRTLKYAFLTLVNLQIGIFNYDEVLDYTPILGALVFGSCIVLITFVVLNLLVAVILVAFNHEKTHHKPSDEEESVDLMLIKICSLFGIRYKDTKDSRGPNVISSSGDLTPNSSFE
ncbi:hypothetical protein Q8A73_010229 [Channa argus]|nr:hypothetical protein Q8A73_010229 [Channa argus]